MKLLCGVMWAEIAMVAVVLMGSCSTTPEGPNKTMRSFSYTREELLCSINGQVIYGEIIRPLAAANRRPAIIFSHGYSSTYRFSQTMAIDLAKRGIVCYTFDFRGGSPRSRSDGKTTEMSVFTQKNDLNAVIDKIKTLKYVDHNRLYLMGESQGGFVTAITATERETDIAGVFLFYPAFAISENANAQYLRPGDIPELIDFMGMTIGKTYYLDLLGYDVYEHIKGYRKSVLIFHGDADRLVPLSHSEKALGYYSDARLIVLPGEGHGFSQRAESEIAKQMFDAISRH